MDCLLNWFQFSKDVWDNTKVTVKLGLVNLIGIAKSR